MVTVPRDPWINLKRDIYTQRRLHKCELLIYRPCTDPELENYFGTKRCVGGRQNYVRPNLRPICIELLCIYFDLYFMNNIQIHFSTLGNCNVRCYADLTAVLQGEWDGTFPVRHSTTTTTTHFLRLDCESCPFSPSATSAIISMV